MGSTWTRRCSRSCVGTRRMDIPLAGGTTGHALPSPVLSGAGAILRLGITAHDRELPRLAIGRPAGGDRLPDASGPHPRAGAGLPAVRHVPAPAGPRGTPG